MMKVIRECGRARNAQGWRKAGPRGLCGNNNLGQPPYIYTHIYIYINYISKTLIYTVYKYNIYIYKYDFIDIYIYNSGFITMDS